MIIVEQSLNVALAIADRAVFMEKGRIRFEGPAARPPRARRPRPGRLPRDRSRPDRRRLRGHPAGRLRRPGRRARHRVCWPSGIVLIYRSSRVINFAVGAMGVLAAARARPAGPPVRLDFWPRAGRRARSSAPPSPPLVEITVITRLFRAPRVILLVATIGIAQLADAPPGRPARDRRRRRGVPDTVHRHLGGRRHPHPRPGAARPRRRPAARGGPHPVPRPHRHRQGDPGGRRQPRAGPVVGHQPEAALDAGLDHRRGAVVGVAHPAGRHERPGRERRRPRSQHARPSARRRPHRRRWCRSRAPSSAAVAHRCRPSRVPVQLPDSDRRRGRPAVRRRARRGPAS